MAGFSGATIKTRPVSPSKMYTILAQENMLAIYNGPG